MTKEQLTNVLGGMEGADHYKTNDLFGLIETLLLSDYVNKKRDLEFLTENLLTQIIDLTLESYDAASYLKWLNANNFSPINNISWCEFYEFSEFETDEELQKVLKNALFVDEDNQIVIASW